MYVWCINSRIDWVAKYLLKTSWNSNTWYAFQESIFDIFPKRNKYYLHLQFTNNLLLHYILAIRVHIWSACMRSFSRSTVRCALRFGLIFFFVCWVSWCFCNIKSICSMNRNSVLLLVSFNSTWQWMKASDQRLKWDPKGGEWVRVRERDRGRTAQGEFDYLRAVASVTNKYISLIFPVQRYTLCMMNCGKPLTKITLNYVGINPILLNKSDELCAKHSGNEVARSMAEKWVKKIGWWTFTKAFRCCVCSLEKRISYFKPIQKLWENTMSSLCSSRFYWTKTKRF